MVEKDFGTRTAGAGIAHGPEIVGGRNADDFFIAQAGNFFPKGVGLIILGIDGNQQLVFRQAIIPGNQVPGILNGVFLEIIAEGEVAEHLEEGVVPGGIADILQIIVLATGTHAFL